MTVRKVKHPPRYLPSPPAPSQKVRVDGWVYCDVHCGVHRDNPDPYDEGENCLIYYQGVSSHWPLYADKQSGA